ncbi:type VI secretion system-associated protein TagF [Simiduia curdlanivorans]|uniref:Type VI secretion system-associated protein TagF n=1 Tax=Simiduia curdlanivorans TaxID=1492769 RepID=A0ABV8V6C3_9GAMM|nr:type VI secretion system-associated protein TagF [Simiduia curdlanivorans]MDN3640220.1 type VI secretion system-associated protein TagF [Simiduia curdlanivorans]
MNNTYEIGIFGKLPAHGDFVERNLPRAFVSVWDEWLQRCLASSQDSAGEQWLDYFLTSPVWRFGLGQGCVDSNAWVGLLVPSVDSVGRYFPITVVIKLSDRADPFDTLLNQGHILDEATDLLVEALHTTIDVDTLWQHLNSLKNHYNVTSSDQSMYLEQHGINLCQTHQGSDENRAAKLIYPLSRLNNASSSLWMCDGNEEIMPTIFTAANLPNPECYLPMITNDWRPI